jgi:hypothetical protein
MRALGWYIGTSNMDEQAIALLTKKIVSDISFWSALVGLLGVVVGALISGIFSYLQSKKSIDSNKEEKTKELLLLKYECMYKDLGDYSKYTQEISLLSIMSIDSGLDIKKLKSNLSNNDFTMHSALYAPKLSVQTQNLNKKLSQVIKPLSELIIQANASRTEKEALIGKVAISSLELQMEVENIRGLLADLTQQLLKT